MTDDGLCAIDISNKKELDFDTIIPDDLKLSVRALIDICVRGSPNEGGVVTNLGQNGGLAVRVTPYRPKVQCGDRGSAPPFMTCRELLDRLPTTGVQERFGPIDDPSAQVVIPKYFTDDDERCGLTVATIDSTDVTDWYKVWAATIAVQVMCIEARKAGGVGYDLGKPFRSVYSAHWPYASLDPNVCDADFALNAQVKTASSSFQSKIYSLIHQL